MAPDGDSLSDRMWPLLAGLLLITMPAVALGLVYGVLSLTQAAPPPDQLTPTVLVELYLIELIVFAVFAYLLYRLTGYAVRRQSSEATETEREDGRSGTADDKR
jgi:hypothetical protein